MTLPTEHDDTATATDTEALSEAPSTTDEGTEDDTSTDPVLRKVRREAQSLRTRLREAEASLTTATDRVLAHDRRALVDAARSAGHVAPDEVHRDVDLATVLDESGAFSVDAATEAVTSLLRERPYLARARTPNLQQGEVAPIHSTPSPTWQGAFTR